MEINRQTNCSEPFIIDSDDIFHKCLCESVSWVVQRGGNCELWPQTGQLNHSHILAKNDKIHEQLPAIIVI